MMKRFLKNIFLFGLIFFLVDKFFFIPMLVNPHQIIDQRIRYALEGKFDEEILILGSSRGARNLLAGKIEEGLKRRTLNFSYPGSNIEFHEFLLRIYLENQNPPDLILLTMDDNSSFKEDISLEFRLDQLYPLSIYSIINNEFIARGERNFLSKFFALGRVSKSTFDFGQQTFTKYDSLSSNGSMPVSFQDERFNQIYFDNNIDYSTEDELESRISAFQKIQSMCAENAIDLVVIFPPNFKNLNPGFVERVKNVTTYGSIYLYQSQNPIYRKGEYFHDSNHLIDRGAEIFTEEIIDFLKYYQKM